MNRNNFSFRAFTSFLMAWAFLALAVSGAILYVSPPGRIANWTDWRLFLLTKSQWQALHTLTAIAVLVGALFHLLKFNWTVFWAYLRKKRETRLQFGRELAGSSLLVVLILSGTLMEFPPFATVVAAGESAKQSWASPTIEPPVPHLEEVPLSEVAQRLNVEPAEASAILQKQGVRVAGPQALLGDIAKQNGRSPRDLYLLLQKGTAPVAGDSETAHQPGTGGWGQKTIGQVVAELEVAPEEAMSRLAARNLKVQLDENMRSAAQRNNLRPFDLMEILKGSK